MNKTEKTYPFLKNSTIEKESFNLLTSFNNSIGKKVAPPIPVFDIIEYLGYNVDFRKDGIYEDKNILGGLNVDEKTVEINENLSHQEGRMNFTAAHETGHIILHAPIYSEQNKRHESNTQTADKLNILCRKDEGFEGDKKEPEEWQADKFAAYLLMPTASVKRAFFRVRRRPINVKRKSLIEIFFPVSPKRKAWRLAEKIL
ncbi:uncharacterized protein METZ01_LOCUS443692, partial [marine metagenome]